MLSDAAWKSTQHPVMGCWGSTGCKDLVNATSFSTITALGWVCFCVPNSTKAVYHDDCKQPNRNVDEADSTLIRTRNLGALHWHREQNIGCPWGKFPDPQIWRNSLISELNRVGEQDLEASDSIPFSGVDFVFLLSGRRRWFQILWETGNQFRVGLSRLATFLRTGVRKGNWTDDWNVQPAFGASVLVPI